MEPEKKQKIRRVLKGFGVFLVVWTVVAMVFPLLPSPWPPFYWALPVHGQVVDLDTGQPLAGVIVVAHWELRDSGWTGSPVGQVAVMETVTDSRGQFTFRWWQPRLRRSWLAQLGSDAPGLLFFKSGYKPESRGNHGWSWYNPFPTSYWNEAVIELKQFHGTTAEYAEKVQRLDTNLEFAFRHHDCSWKKIPRMLVAMDQEGTQLIRVRGYRFIHSLESRADGANERWCGSFTKYMRSYVQ